MYECVGVDGLNGVEGLLFEIHRDVLVKERILVVQRFGVGALAANQLLLHAAVGADVDNEGMLR